MLVFFSLDQLLVPRDGCLKAKLFQKCILLTVMFFILFTAFAVLQFIDYLCQTWETPPKHCKCYLMVAMMESSLCASIRRLRLQKLFCSASGHSPASCKLFFVIKVRI
jgi:hypothetical protein